MKKIFFVIAALIFVILFFRMQTNRTSVAEETSFHPMNAGDVFTAGGYIDVDGIRITYNGSDFEIENRSNKTIIAICQVVGVKSDGTYEPFYWPAFGGIDTHQQEKDMSENGWVINKLTNRVRPGDTLIATLSIYETAGSPNPDIDQDGYYDLMFVICEQENDSIVTTSNNTESEVYKLKAN